LFAVLSDSCSSYFTLLTSFYCTICTAFYFSSVSSEMFTFPSIYTHYIVQTPTFELVLFSAYTAKLAVVQETI